MIVLEIKNLQMPNSSSPHLTPGEEASQLGEELGSILVSEKPDVARLNALMQRLMELGNIQRKKAFEEIRKKAKSNPNHPLSTQLDGPPSRKYLPNIRSIREVASHTVGANKEQYLKTEKNLLNALAVASSRYRLMAHMMPIGLPLQSPQLLGDQIESFVKSKQASKSPIYADWLGADLSSRELDGANLQGAFFDGANFQGVSLVGANLENVSLAGANLSHANLTGANLKGANLGCANLFGTNLRDANLEGAIFDKATFEGLDCQGANMNKASFLSIHAISANFSNANLTHSKWTGINLDADMENMGAKAPSIDDVILPMDIGGIDFSGADLSFATLLGCVAKDGIQFTAANLSKASLQRCHFKKADFSKATFSSSSVVLGSTISESDFSSASITASFFHGANLSHSNFHLARLDKSNFSLTNMRGCSAIQVSASGSHFERANLTNVTFLSSKMVGAIFRNANVSGTCFDDCELTHADFSRASAASLPTFINANLSRVLFPSSMFKE